jgi:hypothetical protein
MLIDWLNAHSIAAGFLGIGLGAALVILFWWLTER